MKFLALAMMVLFCAHGMAETVSVMTYNAENLYDTYHDEGKSDWKWLPVSFKKRSPEVKQYCNSQRPEHREFCFNYDWSKKVLNAKIKNLSKAIKAYHKGQRGPDVVVLQEVENLRVLKQLVKSGLNNEGYHYIYLFEGPDKRGIDIGVISKYRITKAKLHPISLRGTSGENRSTRGVFEVVVKVGRKSLTVLGNHWPSQSNGDDTRLRASEVLENISLKSSSDLVVALGDFNTYPSDSPNGIERNIIPHFVDVEFLARRSGIRINEGTHWYRGHWESLDKIFVLKRSLSARRARVNVKSFRIVNNDFLLRDNFTWRDPNSQATRLAHGVPFRFDAGTLKGASDHLPVAVTLEL